MQNLLLIALAALVGFLIYMDRGDRKEAQSLQLRSFESQSELNRQATALQAKAVSDLTMEIGKLQVTVSNLQAAVQKKFP
jgi:hypothetical protein